ncbi:hypothetical protein [Larkinella sp.]|uniref:hypothetical protein n=1 Tax=Larkinella sp. TaxID=2034517 RepID=UPI003BAD50EC
MATAHFLPNVGQRLISRRPGACVNFACSTELRLPGAVVSALLRIRKPADEVMMAR